MPYSTSAWRVVVALVAFTIKFLPKKIKDMILFKHSRESLFKIRENDEERISLFSFPANRLNILLLGYEEWSDAFSIRKAISTEWAAISIPMAISTWKAASTELIRIHQAIPSNCNNPVVDGYHRLKIRMADCRLNTKRGNVIVRWRLGNALLWDMFPIIGRIVCWLKWELLVVELVVGEVINMLPFAGNESQQEKSL